VGGVGRVALVTSLVLGLWGTSAHAGTLRAGVGMADATWHVGASAGQYATGPAISQDEFDPHVQAFTKRASYGVQSRLQARALVVSDGEHLLAIVKNDLYIPQDTLWRRTAQLLQAAGSRIGHTNLVMSVTHDHSSPYYTSTAWGAWTFQDIFDIRAFDYYARALARAVLRAEAKLVPVRVGAAVVPFAKGNRNALGPAVADDGTPAGYPDSYTDRDLSLVRFDDISDPAHPRPLANLVNFSLHGENLEGNDLISADFVGPLERMIDRESGGALTVFTQNAVGNSENERGAYHSVHDRLYFDHRQYGQAEFNAALIARAALGLWKDVGARRGRVQFFDTGPVALADRWFPGPLTHPFPTVSNCRTDQVLAGNPQLPLVGLPDCAGPTSLFGEVGLDAPPQTAQRPGPTLDDIKRLGIPIPDNYGAPSYTGLEEDISVHLQAFRIGPILFTVCSCEQWADQSRNIKSRTDRIAGNEWMGFDWPSYRGLDDTGVECFEHPPYDGSNWSCPHPQTAKTTPCFRESGGTWSCPNPTKECLLKGDAFTNTCRGTPLDARLTGISDGALARVRAQVRSCANGWNSVGWAANAESEPVDVTKIKGSYTCDDDARSAQLGYALTVPISMANDYNGYIATYREYQRGDHYRKALTGWGPHSSDYMATRMVKLGRQLNGGPAPDRTLAGAPDPDADLPVLDAKTTVDQLVAETKTQVLGAAGSQVVNAYTARLPDEAGPPAALTQPKDVQRFHVAAFTWRGGSNYTDNPAVEVQRLVKERWEPFADQSGEIPVTVRYPGLGDLPAYLTGGQQWRWTAWFEAFASRYDLPGSPRATPAGSYRFVVSGQARRGGRAADYRVVSEAFRVGAWTGIAVDNVRVQHSGRIALKLAPIDYPDSYGDVPGKPRFIKHVRTFVRDPAAPNDPRRFEWFCNDCSFRPWADTGRATRAVVTFARGSRVVARVRGRRSGDRWLTRRHLRRGERAYVCTGDIRDQFGNRNASASLIVSAQQPRGAAPTRSAALRCR
jgi:hypothetical protein